MTGKLHISCRQRQQTILAKAGDNLLDILRTEGFIISAPCGGFGKCKKCIVLTYKGALLACKTIITKDFFDTEIYLPANNKMQILDAYENLYPVECNRNITPPYGIAIDIGTTTLAFELLDMVNGIRIASYSQMNNQRDFGADVMTRITNAVNGAQAKLNAYVIKDICNGILHIINNSGIGAEDISLIAISGNTTMLHLLQNMSCDSLGVAPFTPVCTNMRITSFAKLFGRDFLSCNVIILPGISTFVGADIAAGLLCANWPNVSGNNILIDLGTNGEMAFFSADKIITTSTAAGPAFEAGNISMGMGSVSGAIAKASYLPDSHVFDCVTIGNALPIGICGTGVIDISAELIKNNLVDETGYILSDAPHVHITSDIYFTQNDIREIQLAKAAVRAGIEVLLDIAGTSYQELTNVFIAGGFGHKINLQNAANLGLIPSEFTDKVISLGNASLGGCARVLLSSTAEADILKLVKVSQEINLATHPKFNELFINYMGME